tara:strand:+ start:1517 stop:3835 length:2319 start_codon:yes stop_codon:yes gene_type:complete
MIFFFLLSLSSIFTNTIDISSTILDNNFNPIENVTVNCIDNYSLSDVDGYFSIQCNDQNIVTFNHIKYTETNVEVKKIENFIILSKNEVMSSPVIVYGQFNKISDKNFSTQVIDNKKLNKNSYSHIQEITHKVSNLNYAQGTSRPRYYQIRGLGELSQFSGEGAPHFYVGYSIDNIDFSGIGMIGNLFDIKQIEVFKGPQSTLFGQNSMGGQINITTLEPKNYKSAIINFSKEDFNSNSYNIFLSNKLSNNWNYATTFSKHYSDGYINNNQLNNGEIISVSNTNARNEQLIKLKLNYFNNDFLSKITIIHSDINNNYDVWSPDNNGYTTYTDYRGKDLQKTNAISIYLKQKNNFSDLISISTYSDNEITYSYDSDWGNNEFWSNPPYNFDNYYYGYFSPYNYTDITNRNKINKSQEFRLVNRFFYNLDITSGVIYSESIENDIRDGWLFAGDAININSKFKINKAGLYSSISSQKNKFNFNFGFRYDYNKTKNKLEWSDYYGPAGNESVNVKDSDLYGVNLKIIYQLNNKLSFLSIISSGYKSSGVNMTPNLPLEYKTYNNEYSINYEFGIKRKHLENSIDISFFYVNRKDPQLRVFYQHDISNPNSFDYATFNSDIGFNYGCEFDTRFKISNKLYLDSSIGYLKTHISNFTYLDVVYGNREQAHAPNYTYSINFIYEVLKNNSINLSFNGMDKFYFDDQYNYMSNNRDLIDIAYNLKYKNIELTLFAKNIGDEKYEVRGYTFRLEPPNYELKNYKSYGQPRSIGINLTYSM